MQGTDALAKAFSNDAWAKSTEFEDQYMRVTPSIETASERLSWLNKAAFVGKGKLDVTPEGTLVVYECFKVD
ncbi:uncharacterized protein ACHE_41028S [Aspergillus chevalieri]|uniref:Uncharacterized protein n=1 Tax=Aspergillus chevalieri TaxID=182096 RepID=A0A7R7VR08_ASPCH|nr:uncharacterized protein ACHE_41028S [Aspergillus chevalieri]BCR88464.1 hypothetical protein ACHE_41028S [Aspergillus chevalieri]